MNAVAWFWLDEVSSTQDEARARLVSGVAGPLVIVAAHQVAGRGRRGHVWQSARGSSLTLTLAWPAPTLEAASLAPLAVALGAREGVLGVTGVDLSLKWPNDLESADGRKVGGVLLEACTVRGRSWLLAGIGLNVRLGSAPPGLPAASLEDLGAAPPSPRVLETAIVVGATAWLNRLSEPGVVLTAFAGVCSTLGRPVGIVREGQLTLEGTAAGLGERGELLVDVDGTRVAVTAGEVSVRSR